MSMNMKRYRTDEEFRKRFIGYVNKYKKTEKGKISHNKAQKKAREKGYYSEYMKKRRIKAKKEGICQTCFKTKAAKGLTICSKCRTQFKEYNLEVTKSQ